MSMLDEEVYEGLADFVTGTFFAHENSTILKMTGELYQAGETKIPNLLGSGLVVIIQPQAVTGSQDAQCSGGLSGGRGIEVGVHWAGLYEGWQILGRAGVAKFVGENFLATHLPWRAVPGEIAETAERKSQDHCALYRLAPPCSRHERRGFPPQNSHSQPGTIGCKISSKWLY